MINTDWASPLGSLPLPQPTLGGLPQQQGGSYGALPMPMAGALPQGQPMPPTASAPADTSPSQFAQADFMNTSAPMPTPRPVFGGQQGGFTPPMPTPRPQDVTGSIPQHDPLTISPSAPATSSGTGLSGFLDRLRANSKAANYQMVRPDSLFGHLGNIFSNDPIQKGAGPLSIFAKSLFGG